MQNKKPAPQSRCEDCEYYDYDDRYDEYYCRMDLDEDEAERFARGNTGSCPFYKKYDEYMSVRKQN